MDDVEIERLRKAIRRTYASQPHKIKCWLAVLDMCSSGNETNASSHEERRSLVLDPSNVQAINSSRLNNLRGILKVKAKL
jgi:hypothetical protein